MQVSHKHKLQDMPICTIFSVERLVFWFYVAHFYCEVCAVGHLRDTHTAHKHLSMAFLVVCTILEFTICMCSCHAITMPVSVSMFLIGLLTI